MTIRKGNIDDINSIICLIKEAISDMELKQIHQWDDIYPNEAVIKNDILEENLYVFTQKNSIIGIIVLNSDEDDSYKTLQWKFNGKPLVIHRLCISPKAQGKGIAKKLVEYAEIYGGENHYDCIRLDAFIQNKRACELYEKARYTKVGIVTFRKGDFYCYEKSLRSIKD